MDKQGNLIQCPRLRDWTQSNEKVAMEDKTWYLIAYNTRLQTCKFEQHATVLEWLPGWGKVKNELIYPDRANLARSG